MPAEPPTATAVDLRDGHADGRVGADLDHDLVDAFIAASRALVAVAVRSITEAGDDITLSQFRALLVLEARGAQRIADLAVALEVNPSTASRMTERLVRKQLVTRTRAKHDRRILRVALTEAGQRIVSDVTLARRSEVEGILAAMPTAGRHEVIAALRAFAHAAGEAPEQDWAIGWES